MAHKHNSVLVLLLLATSALAQTMDSKTANGRTNVDPTNNDLPAQVALARCAYSPADGGCTSKSLAPAASGSDAKTTLAQVPRRMGPMGRQGPPMRGPVYPETWGPQFSPSHALIGAAIGFGFGAAAGAKNGAGSAVAVGTLVGLLGAALGAGIPSFPSHHHNRRGWDDDEEASRAKPKPAMPSPPHADSATQVAAARPEPTETYQKNDFSTR